MIKKLLFAALMAVAALGAQAEAMYMHIEQADGTIKVFNVDQIDRLTFTNGVMTATKGNDTVASVKIQDITSVGFVDSDVPGSGVTDATVGAEALAFDANGYLVAGTDAALRVYSTAGAEVLVINNVAAGTRIDLSELEAGIYIVKLGDAVRKIAVK